MFDYHSAVITFYVPGKKGFKMHEKAHSLKEFNEKIICKTRMSDIIL